MVVGLLPWRWGVSGMSNLIVGVRRGGGVGGLGVREGPLITGAHRMWNRPLLKPLKEEESKCYSKSRQYRWGGLYLMSLLVELSRSQQFPRYSPHDDPCCNLINRSIKYEL